MTEEPAASTVFNHKKNCDAPEYKLMTQYETTAHLVSMTIRRINQSVFYTYQHLTK